MVLCGEFKIIFLEKWIIFMKFKFEGLSEKWLFLNEFLIENFGWFNQILIKWNMKQYISVFEFLDTPNRIILLLYKKIIKKLDLWWNVY